MIFAGGFPSKMVPQGSQVEVYVGARLGRRLGGLLERSWEGFATPRCVPRRSKLAPGRAKTAPGRSQDGQRWLQDAFKTHLDASKTATDAKMWRITKILKKNQWIFRFFGRAGRFTRAQHGTKTPQDGAKTHENGARTLARCSRIAPRCL